MCDTGGSSRTGRGALCFPPGRSFQGGELALLDESFLRRSTHSTKAQSLAEKLESRLEKDGDIRELIADEFLILCLVRGDRLVSLSIKHHRQLSYDLKTFWRE